MKLSFCSLVSMVALVTSPGILFANAQSSETIRAEKGLFRLLSADVNEASDYHFRTSLQYFQQKSLLDDVEDSTVRDTKAMIGFGYAVTPHIHLNAHGGFRITSRKPESASTTTLTTGSETIDLVKAGGAVTATYDVGEFFDLAKHRWTAGGSLWIDFSKISRFFQGPNIIPTLMTTGDFSDNEVVPVRAHFNVGFRPANGGRYYSESSTVKDFDRLATETINSFAITSAVGFEFPLYYVTPSIEVHMEKVMNASLARAPKWVTPGLKAKPFPQKNIELFAAADIGLASFDPTPTGEKPEVGPTPLWNVIVGFGISQFGKKAGEVGVDQREYESVKSSLAEKEEVISGLQKDLQYNTLQGRVVDSSTKKPIPDVILSFPESPDIMASRTDFNGRFIRYFRSLTGARAVFAKEGYESSSKFLSLKPGERVSADIELKKSTGAPIGDLVATVADVQGSALTATILLTNTETRETLTARTDALGQLTMKVPAGNYVLEVQVEGFRTQSENISFERGKTVLRSYVLTP